MKKALQMIAVLGVVGLVSGLLLVSMYRYASPQIENNEKKAIERAVYTVLPQAKSYKVIALGEKEIYQGINKSGKVIGYAFKARGSGYQGIIELIVGMNVELTEVRGLEVITSVETPGLGGRIVEKRFKNQFAGLGALPRIEPGQIQAITGATVSSMSVLKILNAEIARIRELLEK